MQTHTPRVLIVAFAALVALIALPGAASASPGEFMQETTDEVMSVLDATVDTEEAELARDEALRATIRSLVDYDDLAARSLGEHWAQRTPEEQEAYRAAFRELVELTYVDRLSERNPDTPYELDWEDDWVEAESVGHVIVWVLYEDTETELHWTLTKSPEGSWLVYDLAVDETSIEEQYREHYTEVLEEEGFPVVLQKMQDRIAELKGEDAGTLDAP